MDIIRSFRGSMWGLMGNSIDEGPLGPGPTAILRDTAGGLQIVGETQGHNPHAPST